MESPNNLRMPGTDVTALKEALFDQQQLLQKLYAELDVEREASATAVSEALSMILRVQGEKSAVMMEASQYKRMAEERLSHAEESLAVLEDLICQKEMEISSLEFHIQAYESKLLSLGVTDLDVEDLENPLLAAGDEQQPGSDGGLNRRLKSLPPIQLKSLAPIKLLDAYQNKSHLGVLSPESMVKKAEEKTDQESDCQSLDLGKDSARSATTGDLNSYWEQIKKLDEKVKEIANITDSGRDKFANLKIKSRSSSVLPQLSTSGLDPKHPDHTPEKGLLNSAGSSSTHDIFEVPQITEKSEINKTSTDEEKGQKKFVWEGEKKLKKLDLIKGKTFESRMKDDIESIKTILPSPDQEKRLSLPTDGKSIHPKVSIAESQPEFQHLSQRIARLEVERNSAKKSDIVDDCSTTTSDFQQLSARIMRLEAKRNSKRNDVFIIDESTSESQQLSQRLARLEAKRSKSRRDLADDRIVELNLLKEIREQLNTMQCEIRSLKPKVVEEPSLDPISEAMLYFWL